MKTTFPQKALQLALKHKVGLGYHSDGYYFVRDRHGKMIDWTKAKNPTAANVLALVRRQLRK